MAKINCWEFRNCGREPGGSKAGELGVCPASVEERLDGTHGGENAGRSCWIVAGTFCKGEVQGTFAKKIEVCKKCSFYQSVKREELPHFKLSAGLLSILE